MRRVIAFFICGFLAASALAQEGPVGVRTEYAAASGDGREYSLFSYTDADGTFGYYLGIGVVFDIMESFREGAKDFSYGHADEVCVWLGASRSEVAETLGRMLGWYDAEVGTVFPVEARGVNRGGGTLGGPVKADCILVRRILRGRRLCFNFVSGPYTARVDLEKGVLKTVMRALEMDGRIDGREE